MEFYVICPILIKLDLLKIDFGGREMCARSVMLMEINGLRGLQRVTMSFE
jgi:hypothetical protein